jgi:hypothetical protein
MSAETIKTSTPVSLLINVAASFNFSSPRAQRTTLAPSLTNCKAVCKPIPLLEPVIIATFPLILSPSCFPLYFNKFVHPEYKINHPIYANILNIFLWNVR